MLKIKTTEEYRVDTEEEAKNAMENFREESKKNGYILSGYSYTKKEKKAKGEIIDEGYLIKVTKVYGGFWE